MSQPPEVHELFNVMKERKLEIEGDAYLVDRQRVLSGMAAARNASKRRRNLQRVLYFAAAAAVLLTGGFWRWGGGTSGAALEVEVTLGTATQVNASGRAALTVKQPVHIVDGELATARDSKATLRAKGGLRVELESQTRVAVASPLAGGQRIRLFSGLIRCSVPHQNAGTAFQVATPDATIVDLGTVFTVSINEANHATEVAVEEGEVMVRYASGQAVVHAPNRWTSASQVAAVPGSVAPPLPAAAPSSVSSAPKRMLQPRPEPGADNLDEEAQLLRQGLAAEHQGHLQEAVVLLSRLLQEHPHSMLAPDARAALARVQARAQP